MPPRSYISFPGSGVSRIEAGNDNPIKISTMDSIQELPCPADLRIRRQDQTDFWPPIIKITYRYSSKFCLLILAFLFHVFPTYADILPLKLPLRICLGTGGSVNGQLDFGTRKSRSRELKRGGSFRQFSIPRKLTKGLQYD